VLCLGAHAVGWPALGNRSAIRVCSWNATRGVLQSLKGRGGRTSIRGGRKGLRSPTRTCLALPYLQFIAASI